MKINITCRPYGMWWTERDVMAWSVAPKHQGSELLCYERESRENCRKIERMIGSLKVPYLAMRDLRPILIGK